MNAWILPTEDVSYLDRDLLDEKGLLKVLPARFYKNTPPNHISLWAGKHGIYVFPTTELVDWLRERIGTRKAIEIGAGNGAIARALNIVATDSHVQNTPEMIEYYRMIGQQTTRPPADVYKFEAGDAVDILKPQVVVAAFVTQKFQQGDQTSFVGSSVFGADELSSLPKVETYIHVGNDKSHGDKRILKFPHEVFRFDWIVTRAQDQSLNSITVWDRK